MKPAAPSPPQKLLVLGHDASRTGAPIFLLHLVRWLQRHGGMELEIVLRHDGPLLAEFQAVAPTRLLAYNRVELVVHLEKPRTKARAEHHPHIHSRRSRILPPAWPREHRAGSAAGQ